AQDEVLSTSTATLKDAIQAEKTSYDIYSTGGEYYDQMSSMISAPGMLPEGTQFETKLAGSISRVLTDILSEAWENRDLIQPEPLGAPDLKNLKMTVRDLEALVVYHGQKKVVADKKVEAYDRAREAYDKSFEALQKTLGAYEDQTDELEYHAGTYGNSMESIHLAQTHAVDGLNKTAGDFESALTAYTSSPIPANKDALDAAAQELAGSIRMMEEIKAVSFDKELPEFAGARNGLIQNYDRLTQAFRDYQANMQELIIRAKDLMAATDELMTAGGLLRTQIDTVITLSSGNVSHLSAEALGEYETARNVLFQVKNYLVAEDADLAVRKANFEEDIAAVTTQIGTVETTMKDLMAMYEELFEASGRAIARGREWSTQFEGFVGAYESMMAAFGAIANRRVEFNIAHQVYQVWFSLETGAENELNLVRIQLCGNLPAVIGAVNDHHTGLVAFRTSVDGMAALEIRDLRLTTRDQLELKAEEMEEAKTELKQTEKEIESASELLESAIHYYSERKGEFQARLSEYVTAVNDLRAAQTTDDPGSGVLGLNNAFANLQAKLAAHNADPTDPVKLQELRDAAKAYERSLERVEDIRIEVEEKERAYREARRKMEHAYNYLERVFRNYQDKGNELLDLLVKFSSKYTEFQTALNLAHARMQDFDNAMSLAFDAAPGVNEELKAEYSGYKTGWLEKKQAFDNVQSVLATQQANFNAKIPALQDELANADTRLSNFKGDMEGLMNAAKEALKDADEYDRTFEGAGETNSGGQQPASGTALAAETQAPVGLEESEQIPVQIESPKEAGGAEEQESVVSEDPDMNRIEAANDLPFMEMPTSSYDASRSDFSPLLETDNPAASQFQAVDDVTALEDETMPTDQLSADTVDLEIANELADWDSISYRTLENLSTVGVDWSAATQFSRDDLQSQRLPEIKDLQFYHKLLSGTYRYDSTAQYATAIGLSPKTTFVRTNASSQSVYAVIFADNGDVESLVRFIRHPTTGSLEAIDHFYLTALQKPHIKNQLGNLTNLDAAVALVGTGQRMARVRVDNAQNTLYSIVFEDDGMSVKSLSRFSPDGLIVDNLELSASQKTNIETNINAFAGLDPLVNGLTLDGRTSRTYLDASKRPQFTLDFEDDGTTVRSLSKMNYIGGLLKSIDHLELTPANSSSLSTQLSTGAQRSEVESYVAGISIAQRNSRTYIDGNERASVSIGFANDGTGTTAERLCVNAFWPGRNHIRIMTQYAYYKGSVPADLAGLVIPPPATRTAVLYLDATGSKILNRLKTDRSGRTTLESYAYWDDVAATLRREDQRVRKIRIWRTQKNEADLDTFFGVLTPTSKAQTKTPYLSTDEFPSAPAPVYDQILYFHPDGLRGVNLLGNVGDRFSLVSYEYWNDDALSAPQEDLNIRMFRQTATTATEANLDTYFGTDPSVPYAGAYVSGSDKPVSTVYVSKKGDQVLNALRYDPAGNIVSLAAFNSWNDNISSPEREDLYIRKIREWEYSGDGADISSHYGSDPATAPLVPKEGERGNEDRQFTYYMDALGTRTLNVLRYDKEGKEAALLAYDYWTDDSGIRKVREWVTAKDEAYLDTYYGASTSTAPTVPDTEDNSAKLAVHFFGSEGRIANSLLFDDEGYVKSLLAVDYWPAVPGDNCIRKVRQWATQKTEADLETYFGTTTPSVLTPMLGTDAERQRIVFFDPYGRNILNTLVFDQEGKVKSLQAMDYWMDDPTTAGHEDHMLRRIREWSTSKTEANLETHHGISIPTLVGTLTGTEADRERTAFFDHRGENILNALLFDELGNPETLLAFDYWAENLTTARREATFSRKMSQWATDKTEVDLETHHGATIPTNVGVLRGTNADRIRILFWNGQGNQILNALLFNNLGDVEKLVAFDYWADDTSTIRREDQYLRKMREWLTTRTEVDLEDYHGRFNPTGRGVFGGEPSDRTRTSFLDAFGRKNLNTLEYDKTGSVEFLTAAYYWTDDPATSRNESLNTRLVRRWATQKTEDDVETVFGANLVTADAIGSIPLVEINADRVNTLFYDSVGEKVLNVLTFDRTGKEKSLMSLDYWTDDPATARHEDQILRKLSQWTTSRTESAVETHHGTGTPSGAGALAGTDPDRERIAFFDGRGEKVLNSVIFDPATVGVSILAMDYWADQTGTARREDLNLRKLTQYATLPTVSDLESHHGTSIPTNAGVWRGSDANRQMIAFFSGNGEKVLNALVFNRVGCPETLLGLDYGQDNSSTGRREDRYVRKVTQWATVESEADLEERFSKEDGTPTGVGSYREAPAERLWVAYLDA
ncbi:MAG: hypothetical protein NC930_05555, partial [Candidatus Omnitrophica bacterium]|nr:hypothetical protein [Candidatus Omnitrophota bacterium]